MKRFSPPSRVEPGPGQESVWDYPRPPRIERVPDRLRVVFAGKVIAESEQGQRVLETSHPPVFYFPPDSVREELLIPERAQTYCEFKGVASYWCIEVGARRSQTAAWSYAHPRGRFRSLAHYFAFYPSRVDECWVGEERVEAQAGNFYGGWITSRVVGPFKGQAGTGSW